MEKIFCMSFICPYPLIPYNASSTPSGSSTIEANEYCAVPCPTFALRPRQWDAITVGVTVFSIASFVLSLTVFLAHLPQFKRYYIRIMFIAGFMLNSLSLATFMFANQKDSIVCSADKAHYFERSPICVLQATILIWTFLWTELWSVILAFDTYLHVTLQHKRYKGLRTRYTIAALIVPTVITAIPVAYQTVGFDPNANIPFCLYLVTQYKSVYWVSFVIPFYTFLFISLGFTLACAWRIHEVFISSKHYEIFYRLSAQTNSGNVICEPLLENTDFNRVYHHLVISSDAKSGSSQSQVDNNVFKRGSFGEEHLSYSYADSQGSRSMRSGGAGDEEEEDDIPEAGYSAVVEQRYGNASGLPRLSQSSVDFQSTGRSPPIPIVLTNLDTQQPVHQEYSAFPNMFHTPMQGGSLLAGTFPFSAEEKKGVDDSSPLPPPPPPPSLPSNMSPQHNSSISTLTADSRDRSESYLTSLLAAHRVGANRVSVTNSPSFDVPGHELDPGVSSVTSEGFKGSSFSGNGSHPLPRSAMLDRHAHTEEMERFTVNDNSGDSRISSSGGSPRSGSAARWRCVICLREVMDVLTFTVRCLLDQCLRMCFSSHTSTDKKLNDISQLLGAVWHYNGRSILFVVFFGVVAIVLFPFTIREFYVNFQKYSDSSDDLIDCLISASEGCAVQTQQGVNECAAPCGTVPRHHVNVFMVSECCVSPFYPLIIESTF